jgi:hypothetical protein
VAAGRSLTQQQLEAAAPSNSSADATAISAALAKGDLNAASLAIAEASARGNVAALADAMAISLASGACKRSLFCINTRTSQKHFVQHACLHVKS